MTTTENAPRERATPDLVAQRLALAKTIIDHDDRPEDFDVEDALTDLAKEVVRLRDYAEECYELLEADRGWDVLDDVDKRLRKLYMGLNGKHRWSHGTALMRYMFLDPKDVPPVDIEGDHIDQWDRLVSLAVWATTYAVAQGRWAVVEHRNADRLRDALLNGVDWFTGACLDESD